MPSYAAAAEERPVTVSGEQPPRQLAQRKNAPGAGRPPNPFCCGKSTKRISTGSSIVRCEVCEKIYSPGDPLPPQSVKPAGKPAEVFGPHCPSCATLTRERDGKWWCKWCEIELPQDSAAETTAAAEVSPKAPSVSPKAPSVSPKAPSVSPKAPSVSPKAPSVAQRAPEISSAPSPFATGRRGPKPLPVLGAGLGEKETKRLQEDLGATRSAYVPCWTAGCAEPAHDKPFEGRFYCPRHRKTAVDDAATTVVSESPGLNGDHATRAQERAKIPPSRPANNSRGDEEVRKVGEFTFYRGEPPPRRLGAPTSPLGQAIRELQPGEFIKLPADGKTHGHVRSILHNLREKKICPGLQTYLSADRSARIVMRKSAGDLESEAPR